MKSVRRILAIFVASLMTLSLMGISAGAQNALEDYPSTPAEQIRESEPNNSMTNANAIRSNQVIHADVNGDYDEDYYRLNVENPGLLLVEHWSTDGGVFMDLLNAEGELVAYSELQSYDHESGVSYFELNQYINTPGVYYLKFGGGSDQKTYQTYCVFRKFINQFVDVTPDRFFYIPVQWATAEGIASGSDSTHFAPDRSCTREQMVTFLWRYFGCPEHNMAASPFSDVQPGDYYYDAVLWAVEYRITKGLYPGTFGAGQPCTRAQTVTFLYNAFSYPIEGTVPNMFEDVSKDAYYYEAVQWAVHEGITSGINARIFSPYGLCTRAQAVTFLFNSPPPAFG